VSINTKPFLFISFLTSSSSAPPDRGLSTKQMSGKKADKFRITLGLACNSDGSEKLPPLFIGKSAKPVPFQRKSPRTQGFVYYNNKKAWMTMEIFEECVYFLCSLTLLSY
jgi:hypothetical protein